MQPPCPPRIVRTRTHGQQPSPARPHSAVSRPGHFAVPLRAPPHRTHACTRTHTDMQVHTDTRGHTIHRCAHGHRRAHGAGSRTSPQAWTCVRSGSRVAGPNAHTGWRAAPTAASGLPAPRQDDRAGSAGLDSSLASTLVRPVACTREPLLENTTSAVRGPERPGSTARVPEPSWGRLLSGPPPGRGGAAWHPGGQPSPSCQLSSALAQGPAVPEPGHGGPAPTPQRDLAPQPCCSVTLFSKPPPGLGRLSCAELRLSEPLSQPRGPSWPLVAPPKREPGTGLASAELPPTAPAGSALRVALTAPGPRGSRAGTREPRSLPQERTDPHGFGRFFF